MAHPHAVLGSDYIEHDWDFSGGEAEYEKAFQLDSNDATAQQWYAEDVVFLGGHEEKAIASIDRAHQLDPASVIIDVERGYIRSMAGRVDDGLTMAKLAVADHPDFPRARLNLSIAYRSKKMYAESIAEFKTFAKLYGDPATLAVAEAQEEGFRQGGWKIAMRKGAAAMVAHQVPGGPTTLAAELAEANDNEGAFQWLETAFRQRDKDLIQLKADFRFDALRDDPRFAELVKKVGLP